jgi:nicotinate-nucleotide pyrophosphorylase (carboxylating)
MADYPFSPFVDELIRMALMEDLAGGDLTSDLLFAADAGARGRVLAKQDLVLAGLGVFERVLAAVDARVRFEARHRDGERVAAGTVVALVEGPARSVLRAERTALNFLRHLSGVATLTARYVAAAGPDGPRVVDTRKTTPGFRELEKYAVRCGGGRNHRFNLGSAVMIKDNHIAAVGSIAEAVRRARAGAPHTAHIEVETNTLDEVQQALDAGADSVLLDNMDDETMAQAVALCRGRALTEASGNITDARLASLARVGVDIVSSGALTHSAPAADLSLDLHT